MCCLAKDCILYCLIPGSKRWLSVTSFSSLKTKLSSCSNQISGSVKITIETIGEITGCTVYSTSEANGQCVVVAATSKCVSVLTYSHSKSSFSIMQVGGNDYIINKRNNEERFQNEQRK